MRRRGSACRIVVDGLVFRAAGGIAPDTAVDPVAPALVLLHGLGMSMRAMRRLHARLQPGRRVLSIDMAGHGGLPTPRRDVDVPTMAAALGGVLDRLDVRRAVLVGHSMGAQWAIELAVQRPGLVERVVAIGPVVDPARRTAREQTVALLADAAREPLDVGLTATTDYLRCGVGWYAPQLRQMLAYPLERRARALPVPLLVLRGEHDAIADARWCRALRDLAPHGALARIPGHHHAVQLTAPRAVAAAILAGG